MVGATASLWLVGRMGKSLTKAFKEQGKTIKDRVQGVYQGKKHLQSLVPDDYFEFDE
jgi:gas vesicle protein